MSALDTLFGQSAPAAPAPSAKAAAGTPPAAVPDASPEASPTVESGELGNLGDLPPDGQVPSDASSEDTPAAPQGSENVFEFAVTDDKGRRKVKVDLNDKEKLARILPQAYGFRKMQAERDTAQAKLKEAEPRLQELETNWQTLEKTYQEGGVEGLVDLLGGKRGHYKEFLEQELAKTNRYKTATQAEKERIDLEDKLSRLERDSKLREQRAAEEAKKAVSERESADLTNLEAQLTPAFNKYRFAGTLGNDAQERAFDQAIWNQAIANLEQVPDSTPLTAALIEKEFKTVALTFKAAIGKQASAKTRQALEKTKQAAQTQVAAAAQQSLGRPSGINQQMTANIKRGGVGGLTAGLMDILRAR